MKNPKQNNAIFELDLKEWFLNEQENIKSEKETTGKSFKELKFLEMYSIACNNLEFLKDTFLSEFSKTLSYGRIFLKQQNSKAFIKKIKKKKNIVNYYISTIKDSSSLFYSGNSNIYIFTLTLYELNLEIEFMCNIEFSMKKKRKRGRKSFKDLLNPEFETNIHYIEYKISIYDTANFQEYQACACKELGKYKIKNTLKKIFKRIGL